jgi:hypothetical protein
MYACRKILRDNYGGDRSGDIPADWNQLIGFQMVGSPEILSRQF